MHLCSLFNSPYVRSKEKSFTPTSELESKLKDYAADRVIWREKVVGKIAPRVPGFVPANVYLRKMRRGSQILPNLRTKEVTYGQRVAVINAVGGINSGKSGNGATGRSLGSDSLIKQVRQAKKDPSIVAVVLRVDSPGGSALARYVCACSKLLFMLFHALVIQDLIKTAFTQFHSAFVYRVCT